VIRRRRSTNDRAEKEIVMSNEKSEGASGDVSRRSMFGVGSTLATAVLAGVAASAQERANTRTAERDRSASNPGPENRALLQANPNSNTPPAEGE